MSDKPTKGAELLLLCGKVRDDAITADDAKRLDALLQASDQAKALYVQYMSVVSLLESRGIAHFAEADDAFTSEEADQNVFAELLAFEQQAEAELVHHVGQLRSRDDSPWQIGGAVQWLVHRPTVIGAVAAMLALALVLVVVFQGGPGRDPDPMTNVVEPSTPTAEVAKTVATLTATHNAQWAQPSAERALARGSSLYPGTRLTLTAGFAEITTKRGAIAILEAPCVVELKDNDNALHLHAGKLVGICETPSSKGFLVRTPHMDVIDLGTRFGVDATQPDQVEVHVIEGEVVARQLTPDADTPIVLTIGQALRVDRDRMTHVDFDDQRFAQNAIDEPYRPRFEGLPSAWLGQSTTDLRPGQQVSPALQVFLERINTNIAYAIAINVDQATSWPNPQAEPPRIGKDNKLDVYLLHLEAPAQQPIAPSDGSFVLHFERPVLGVALIDSTLALSDKRFSLEAMTYPESQSAGSTIDQALRGLNTNQPTDKQETVEIFNDGKSLRIHLDSTDKSLDQLRVFVQAAETTD